MARDLEQDYSLMNLPQFCVCVCSVTYSVLVRDLCSLMSLYGRHHPLNLVVLQELRLS